MEDKGCDLASTSPGRPAGFCPKMVMAILPLTPEPSMAWAVTITVPSLTAWSKPLPEITALSVAVRPSASYTDHVTLGMAAWLGRTCACSCSVPPKTDMALPPKELTVMELTGTTIAAFSGMALLSLECPLSP
ncbi:MAG: hypothetical protein K0Q90_2002 [Paenibacillaceae bacterium]|nr:hypothetical protein [Paenibacillaceae bacterium]